MIGRVLSLLRGDAKPAQRLPGATVAPPTFPPQAVPARAPAAAAAGAAAPAAAVPAVKVAPLEREWPHKLTDPNDPRVAQQIQRREEVLAQSSYFKHWKAIKAEGISASQFIEFLQPFADLDGISVSYVYSDADGNERIYNHRKEDSFENPLSMAIKEKKISKDQALNLALNEEGRVWIESNFMDLK
jgi:hypothetical protein